MKGQARECRFEMQSAWGDNVYVFGDFDFSIPVTPVPRTNMLDLDLRYNTRSPAEYDAHTRAA